MTLNTPVIRLLVAKDWQLFQKQLAFYVLAGIVALCFLGLAKPWAFYVGSLMLLIVMVSAACFSISTSLMVERKEQTRSEEHTSELQSLMRTSYAAFCLKKKKILRK